MYASTPSTTIAPQLPQLRPYQVKVVNDLYQKLANGQKRIALIAGTGAGKTVISGRVCYDAAIAGKKVIFLVHLDVLVDQTYEKMKAFGLDCGFIKSGKQEARKAPIQIASTQSCDSDKRQWWKCYKADVIVYDEAHTTLFHKASQEMLYRTHPHAIHIGMTATPERLGKEQLSRHLRTWVAAPVPRKIQEMGYLSKMRYFALPYDHNGAEFEEKGNKLRQLNSDERINQIVREYWRLAPGKRAVAFCQTVKHAERLSAAFKKSGIDSAAVSGKTPLKERKKLYNRLGQGKFILTSRDVISIGFDEPSVEVGLLLRSTESSSIHFQQIGRVMRISPETGKTHGIIIDQAGNLAKHGFPEDVSKYSLPKEAA